MLREARESLEAALEIIHAGQEEKAYLAHRDPVPWLAALKGLFRVTSRTATSRYSHLAVGVALDIRTLGGT